MGRASGIAALARTGLEVITLSISVVTFAAACLGLVVAGNGCGTGIGQEKRNCGKERQVMEMHGEG